MQFDLKFSLAILLKISSNRAQFISAATKFSDIQKKLKIMHALISVCILIQVLESKKFCFLINKSLRLINIKLDRFKNCCFYFTQILKKSFTYDKQQFFVIINKKFQNLIFLSQDFEYEY